MTKVTVVITTYNLERYIATCLDELLAQTFQDFDLLIFDDYSNDSTVSVMETYRKNFKDRLRFIVASENMGSPARSRNAAMDSGLIHGEYVVFLDGDDNIKPDFLEKLYGAATCNHADITMCAYSRIEEESKKVLCTEMTGFPKIIDMPPKSDILAFINGSLWNKLIVTKLIDDTRIPDFKVGEDLSFLQALYRKCKRIVSIQEDLIHYNVRTASVISNTQQATIIRFAEEFVIQYQQTNEPELKETIALTAFIHIGISMAIRAYDNKNIDIKKHLQWTTQYFYTNFAMFRKMKFLKLTSLFHHGIKGFAIWICKILYILGCFRLFLATYRFITKTLSIDFKF